MNTIVTGRVGGSTTSQPQTRRSAPSEKIASGPVERNGPTAWCQTTISAATPRRYWIGRITRDGGEGLSSDIAGILPQRCAKGHAGQSSGVRRPALNQAAAGRSKWHGSTAFAAETFMQLKSTAWILAGLMCGAAIAGVVGRPNTTARQLGDAINLETAVPKQFGEWVELPDRGGQVVNPQTRELLDKIYSQILTRTYVSKSGYQIMLSLAYGDDQRGGLQAHRPEVCYPAQGFKLGKVEDGALPTQYGTIEVRRLTTSLGARNEPVTYWLTVGDQVDPLEDRQAHRRDPPRPHGADSRRAAVSRLVDRQRHGPRLSDAAEVRRRHDGLRSPGLRASSSADWPRPAGAG